MISEHLMMSIVTLIFSLLFLPKMDNKKDVHRHIVIFIIFLFSVRYIAWRFFVTVLPADILTIEGAWIWFCFLVEWMILGEAGIFFLLMCKRTDRIPEADRYECALRSIPDNLPHVDVMIPTYNEPIDVIERSIQGALHIDWPKEKLHVWVLDDGKKPWLEEYCKEKGAGYITREVHSHAKAGNVNHGVSQTKSPFIAIFDADFVAHRNFLYRTIGFFADEKVGILQTPQHFFNKDFLQANLHLHSSTPDEQRIFFDVMMPSRDGWDAAFWCGSCSVTRRSAFVETGGVPHDSITEDLLTTLVMLRHGYVTRYLCEKLSHGLAPESLSSLLIQRQRWCRGTIQAMYSKNGPFGPGLNFFQRVLFLPIHWILSPIARLMGFLIPMVYLWTGIPALLISHFIFTIDYHVPFLILNFYVMFWFAPRHHVPILSTAMLSLNSIQILPTVFHSLVKPFAKGFGVTPKGKAANRTGGIHWYSFGISAFMFFGTLFGLILNIEPDANPLRSAGFFPIAAYWGTLNLVMAALMMLLSVEHPRFRHEERFTVNKKLHIFFSGQSGDFHTHDISMGGIMFDRAAQEFESNTALKIYLEDVGEIPGRVVYVKGKDVHVRFDDLEPVMRDNLIRHIYTGQYDNAAHLHSFKNIVFDLVRRAFGHHEHIYGKKNKNDY